MNTEFTPFLSLIGGMLIGLAAVLLMASNGRIAGISGIISRLLPPDTTDENTLPSVAFVIGLLIALPIYQWFTNGASEQSMVASLPLLLVAGLLVGFGSGYGSGCTSGHGVCGISRLSMRSIIATLTFMATGIITVYVVRHIVGASL